MRNNIISRIPLILTMALASLLAANAFGQDMRSDTHQDGYGSYQTMGQDPDEILKYGRDMMRYGFHETGMSGGSNKYPGYTRYLSNETVNALNVEQEVFIRATEELRQTIYEKELYLKSELAKKNPDIATALNFQKNISEAKAKFEQKMIEHLIRMKKVNLEAKHR